MSIQKKLTELTAKTGALEGTDVLVISDYNGATYDTKKITGSQIVPYKVYITNISQTGTSAPTTSGGYSQLTGTITLARTTTGTYTLTNSVAEFTANNTFLFFGEVTDTPYGRFPLYPKISKDNNKPLTENELRFVEIKKYRE